MINALFNQSNYVATKKLLDATVTRHEALSSNLANVETPKYKRLDVAPTFLEELRRAIASKDTHRISSVEARRQHGGFGKRDDGDQQEFHGPFHGDAVDRRHAQQTAPGHHGPQTA